SGAPMFVQTTTTVVRPSMVADYEDYVKKIGAAAAKVGGQPRVSVYQAVQGTRNFTYLSAMRLANWAALDNVTNPADLLTKAFGDAEAARIIKTGRAGIETSEVALSRYMTEMSTNFRLPDPIPAFANMIRTQIKPDGGSAYQEYLTKLKAAQEQTPNHPPQIRVVSVQGPALWFGTVAFFNKYAERESWPNAGDVLRKSVGDVEARRLTEASNRAIEHRETWLLRYRQDLSRGGARANSN